VDGVVAKPAETSAALRGLLDSLNVKENKVALAVTGVRSVQRYLTVPRLSGALLEKAVIHDAESTIHIPVEELYVFWNKVGESEGEQEMFVLAVPRAVLDSQIAVLTMAKLKPLFIDSKPLAVARAANRKNGVIIDVENDTLHIIVVHDGLPRIMRNIPYDECAEDVRLLRLQEEFDTTLRLYETSFSDTPLSDSVEVVVSGKACPRAESAPALANLLHHAVSIDGFNNQALEGFPSAEYAVNLGLVARAEGMGGGRDGARIPVLGMLPPEFIPKKLPVREFAFAPVVLIGIVTLASLFQMYGDAQARTSLTQNESQTMSQQMKIKQAETKKITEAEKVLADAITALRAIEKDQMTLLPGAVQYQPALKTAGTDLLGGEIVLLTADQSGGKLLLTGATVSHHKVVSYANRLALNSGFSKVDIVDSRVSIVSGEKDKVQFNFNIDGSKVTLVPGDEITLFTIAATK
jgi:hypothetical protein